MTQRQWIKRPARMLESKILCCAFRWDRACRRSRGDLTVGLDAVASVATSYMARRAGGSRDHLTVATGKRDAVSTAQASSTSRLLPGSSNVEAHTRRVKAPLADFSLVAAGSSAAQSRHRVHRYPVGCRYRSGRALHAQSASSRVIWFSATRERAPSIRRRARHT